MPKKHLSAHRNKVPTALHDRYVRTVLQLKELALPFFRYALRKIPALDWDWEHLEPTSDSFVDEQLKHHFTDVVYQCKTSTGNPVRISLLVEHKSHNPPKGSLREQLCRYIINTWLRSLHNKEPFVITIPIVLHHGSTPLIKYSTEELFPEVPTALLPYAPDFDYIVIDLFLESEEHWEREESEALAFFFQALKYSREKEILAHFWDYFITFVVHVEEKTTFRHFLLVTIQYLEHVSTPFKNRLHTMRYDPNLSTPEEIVSAYLDEVFDRRYPGRREREMEEYKQQIVQQVTQEVTEQITQQVTQQVTQEITEAAEKALARSKEEARVEGMQQGLAKVIKTFSKRNPEMSIQSIAESFELDTETVRHLLQM